jgi:hypothetical protein
LTTEQTGQSRQGRLKAVYGIQPSLAGLTFIVEADPGLRPGLLSDVPSGLVSRTSVRGYSWLLHGVSLEFAVLVEAHIDLGAETRNQKGAGLQMQGDRRG